MTDIQLEPARTIIGKVGGVGNAAKATGKHVSRIYRWMKPREKGGTGGIVPHDDALKLMEQAKAEGWDLEPADFFGEAA